MVSSKTNSKITSIYQQLSSTYCSIKNYYFDFKALAYIGAVFIAIANDIAWELEQ